MNAFDQARREVVAALLMEYHRSPHSFVDYEELVSRYSLKTKKEWFGPIIKEIDHLLTVSETYDDISAIISPRGYGEILRECLQNLQANSLEIDWNKEEILSDAKDYHWFPIPNGWKWFTFDGESRDNDPASPAAIDSAQWTGLPADFSLSENRRVQLVRALDAAEEELGTVAELGQEAKSQVRAYVVAARALAEAPDPPADVIWELINRANALARITSLFVSILALFVAS